METDLPMFNVTEQDMLEAKEAAERLSLEDTRRVR
jgi:hypothetical protein